MKKTLGAPIFLCVLLALLLLPACLPGGDYDALQADYEALQAELNEAQAEVSRLNADMATLETAVSSLRETINQTVLSNPTWAEMAAFLKLDDTDAFAYDEDKFDCTGFAITFRDRAWRAGLRCAYVEISFSGKAIGHALNAFETSDRGLVYIDAQDDCLAYVVSGQPYGTIVLDSLLETYIDCSGSPAEFWEPLRYTTHPDILSYDYYNEYQKRVKFQQDTITAFNRAVTEYNSGGSQYTHSQLNRWTDNIDALSAEFGDAIFQAEGKVDKLQVYWN